MLTDPKLGDIVVANSHPYWQENPKVNIAGDSQLISPLMVIVEILSETRDRFDERTGIKLVDKGNAQCKCVWFGTNSHSFVEGWFSSKNLKIFRRASENELWVNLSADIDDKKIAVIRSLYLNRSVVLKTTMVETNKRKITSSEIGYFNDRTTKTTFPQSFVSPTCEVIDVKIPEENKGKLGVYDPKTGSKKRYLSAGSVKCKWYNSNSEKWSEHFLPIEAISLIEIISEEKLNDVSEVIESDGYYKCKSALLDIPKAEPIVILKPKAINNLNGSYFLAVHDIVHEKMLDILLSTELLEELEEIKEKDVFTGDHFPNFNFSPGAKAPKTAEINDYLNALIDKASREHRYILINYKNSNDQLSRRVLKTYFIVPKSEKNGSDYLHGYCCSKREMRTFRIDGIRNIKVLSLRYKALATKRRRVRAT